MTKASLVGFVLFLLAEIGGWAGTNWWAEHPQPVTWAEGRDQLGENLLALLKDKKAADIKPETTEADGLRLWQWLGEWNSANSTEDGVAFRALGENRELRRAFLENLRPEDDQKAALRILIRMQSQAPIAVQELPRLAVALALVFDQPFPKGWPHHQVPASAVPMEEVDPVQRLENMADLQRSRRYLTDLRDFTVSELKFIVDHPLVDSEMEWARKNVIASRSGFSKVFSSIRYDIPRYKANQLDWPYAAYTFAEIRAKGGICVDQAYFAANTGKAKGLPTLYFSGQGDSGGHAWFGLMDSPGHWETDCGRYESQNYPVGNAMDPQIWKPISDTELEFLSKSRERSSSYQQARLLTDIASTLGRAQADRWLDAALEIQPEFLPAWNLRAQILTESQASPEKQREFWTAYTVRFARYPDLKVVGQEKMLELAKVRGDEIEVRNLSRQILVQNRTKRFDLGIGAAAGEVGEKIEAGKWSEAETAYRRALREFKGQAGGHLFYGLVEPFVEAALADGQAGVAKSALQEARRVLKPTKESLVGRSFLELESKLAIP
ncbi:MAG: hypothetical protein NTZ01_05375 [Verrucomicrobia bacterium]|nr:hypothetical protein [Verrucomicrobiota bacterium]